VVMLVSRWHRRTWKFVLFAWLAYEVLDTVWKMQGRTEAALLLLTAIVSYHRLVRPLRLGRAVLTAVLLLAAILLYGLMRDVGGVSSADRRAAWGSPTEFLVLYGTAYDIASRKALGILPPVPPQLYFSDFYRVVPSQLLPFYKWDPSDWYLVEVLEIRDGSIGLMFGMIAQAELGRAHVELAVRGLLLALFYAFVHRAYHRYSVSFWATIGYLFLLTWSYYAFRSTSFDILYRAVYYLLPTVLLVTVTTLLLGPLLRGKRPA
ncbi:MAG TPA: hypothetical protein VHL59_00935, partial [Thermoanaerobaculia bacterium]|nr:hypothetical protein [Thermoanaerobaculia bacterium]